MRVKREPEIRKGLSMNKAVIIGVLFIIVLFIILFTACQNIQPSNLDETPSFYTITDADFNEFAGKIVVLDFFATWCGSCIEEIPHLAEIVNTYDNSEVEVISVGSSSDSEIELRQFKEDHNMNWIVTRDTVGVFDKYDIWIIPTIVILDPNGNIHFKHVGLVETSQLSSKINELLND